MRRSTVSILAVIVSVSAALLGSGSPAVAVVTPLPPEPALTDRFYVAPSPLPTGAPGDVIRWRPVKVPALFGLLATASPRAYQVMYRSTSATGRPIAVTGTVFVPKGTLPANVPIVGYAASTQGIADACAPSRQLMAGTNTDLVNINDAITRGWGVAYSDYQGLGTKGVHTYMIGPVMGHAVLDAVRAAQRLKAAGLPDDGPVGLWGYSQGGSGAGWAAQLAGSYAPELDLKGTAAGGTPADLAVVAKNLNTGTNAGFAFLMMAGGGLTSAYPELDLGRYLNDAGRAAFVDLLSGQTCVTQAVLKYAFGRLDRYTTSNPLVQPAWQARIAAQKLGLTRPSKPVFLYHGLQDQFIPFDQAVKLKRDWCARGQRVAFGPFVGEHVTTFVAGQVDAQRFLAGRFAGKRAPSSC